MASPSARSSSVSVSVSVPDLSLGLAYIRVPDADHIGADLAEHTHVFGTRNFGTRIFAGHAGEHSIIRTGIHFYVAAIDERSASTSH